MSQTPDDHLGLDEIRALLERIESQIDAAPNRVRYTMNGSVIAVGTRVLPFAKLAKAIARTIGKVEVDMHGTSCRVPLATERIATAEKAGQAGRKRKRAKRERRGACSDGRRGALWKELCPHAPRISGKARGGSLIAPDTEHIYLSANRSAAYNFILILIVL